MKDFKDKVAVITGAASGIGLAMAHRFAEAGMHTVLVDIEEEPLHKAAAAIEGKGVKVLPVVTDVADEKAMDALGEQVRGTFEHVHLLCNNAGVGGGGLCWETTAKEWDFVLGVNLLGVIHGIRVFVPGMVKQKAGHVVNTASLAGLITPPGMGSYNVSKHGVVALSETLYRDLKMVNSPVGVSVLCPGFVKTAISDANRHRERVGLDVRPTMVDKDGKTFSERVMANAMEAGPVADAVFAALEKRDFYVLTHESTKAGIQRRMQGIVDAADGGANRPGLLRQGDL